MDVPPALSARVRLLDAGRRDKNDARDARSTAIVALRHRALRVVGVEDHRQVLRLLARRHHQLVAGRTRAICRVHALLAETIEGGATRNLTVNTTISALRRFRPTDTIGRERKRLATAPIEASSGPKVRHRLNPNGNRQLNHAIHIAALGQISHDTPGRAYYLAKQTEGKSRKEAMRCLKRRISDAIYRQLLAETDH